MVVSSLILPLPKSHHTQLIPKRHFFPGRGAESAITWGGQENSSCGALASFILCSVFVSVVLFRNPPLCSPPLVEDHKLRCLPCMLSVCVFRFCSLTAEPQPVWVLGEIPFQRKPSLHGNWIYTG